MDAVWRSGALLLALTACSGPGDDSDTDPDTDPTGCGDVTTHTITVIARVEDGAGSPFEGATVRLEERNWDPHTLGEGTTDASGDVTLADLSVTGVERCWGTALDYVLVATDGTLTAEADINSFLFANRDAGEADRRAFPLVLE